MFSKNRYSENYGETNVTTWAGTEPEEEMWRDLDLLHFEDRVIAFALKLRGVKRQRGALE